MGRRKSDGLKSKINVPYLPILKGDKFFIPYCSYVKTECSGEIKDCDPECDNYQNLEMGPGTRPFPRNPFTQKLLEKLVNRKKVPSRVLVAPTEHDEHGFAYVPYCSTNMHPGVPEERICLIRQCPNYHRLFLEAKSGQIEI